MKKMLCALLSACMLLCLAACGEKEPPATETSSTTASTQEQTQETTQAPQPTDPAPTTQPPMPTEEQEDPSLAVFRQCMVETPQLFAAAFLGYVPPEADPLALMRQAAPELCENLPFLTAIGEDKLLGTYGYLFCIVPADENATVAVNRRPWNGEAQRYEEPELLYRSESGAAILVMCPNEDWIPDTEVVITDSSGAVIVWSPALDPDYHIYPAIHDSGETAIFDFTPYDELSTPG